MWRLATARVAMRSAAFKYTASNGINKMKKAVAGLAVLTAISGGAAAQTSVSIYGVMDIGIARRDDSNPAGKTVSMESGQQSGSRLGFKGREDLGGGMAAQFVLESGINLDNGTTGQGGRLFGRQAWVGLDGNFGGVKLGRQQTVLYTALDKIDPFHINLAGNSQKVFGYGTYAADPFLRTDNTIAYSTPTLAGLNGTLSYSLGEQAGDYSAKRSTGLGLSYANGPLNLQLAYLKSNTVAAPAGFGEAVGDNRALLLGGTYDFGMATAHLGYAENRLGSIGGGKGKDRNLLAGVTVPVGAAGSVMASFIRNELTDLADGRSDQYALGYSHKLSKRTNVYTSVSYTRNGNDVALNTYRGEQLGQSVRLFNVGVRHAF
jgi:predicted porin